MTYLELRTAIAAYLHRTDLTAEIILFITRAEQRIGRDLRIIENRIQATVTPSSGIAALPTRMAEIRRISTGSGATLRILKAVSAHAGNDFGTGGNALAYYLSDKINLLPSSDTDIDIDFYEFPEPLVGDVDGATRPILSRYENLYLDGSLAEAGLFLKDYDAYTIHSDRYSQAVLKANAAAAQANAPVTRSSYNYAATAPRGI